MRYVPNARTPLVLALTAALGGIASAQPGPMPQPPPPPMDTEVPPDPMPPAPDPQPQPQPMPQPQPQPVYQQQPMVQEEPEQNSRRPDALSVGIGAGYNLPTSLETPNITSLRVRLPSGLEFEPALRIQNSTETSETPIDEQTDKETRFSLAALVRFPLVMRNRVDLQLIGFAGFDNIKNNPEGDYNTTTTNAFTLGYGVAVGYWITRHWNFTMNITNPLVAYAQAKTQVGPGMSTTDSGTTLGLIFIPDVFMMIHLYH